MKSTFYLLSILAAAAAKASFDSQASGAQVSFPPELFDQSGASPTIQLSAQDSPARFMLNEYDYGTGFESRRRVFSYYPQKAVQASSDSICVGVINGIARGNKGDAPGGKNGGCDGIWGYGCSDQILKAIKAGCSANMFSGISAECGRLTTQVNTQVSQTSFSAASPAVWLTWNYNISNPSVPNAASEYTFPVFTRGSDGQPSLACLRVGNAATYLGASFGPVLFAFVGVSYYLL